MEARAINRYVGTSPRKMRLVIDLIRGRNVDEALTILHFAPKHAARTAEKVLRSALANLQNKDESGRLDTSTLYVKEAFVDGGPMLKRISPAPMGRAYRIRKRSNHITITVAQRQASVKPAVVRPKNEAETKPEAVEAAAKPKTTKKPAASRAKTTEPTKPQA
jgi:large subunit ribosomal protein L22